MRVNWTDKQSVVDYAKSFGGGHTVFKHPDRNNYNITHTSRFKEPQYRDCVVIHQT